MTWWVLIAFFTGFYLGMVLMSALAAAGKDHSGCMCHPGLAEDWDSPEDNALWGDR